MRTLDIPVSQLPRFIARGYIESPRRLGLGRGKGTSALYAPGTLDRLDVVASILKVSNRRYVVLAALKSNGFTVPSEPIRDYVAREMQRRLDVAKLRVKRYLKLEKIGRSLSEAQIIEKTSSLISTGKDPNFESSLDIAALEESEEQYERRSGTLIEAFSGLRTPDGSKMEAPKEEHLEAVNLKAASYPCLKKCIQHASDDELTLAFFFGVLFAKPEICLAAISVTKIPWLAGPLHSSVKSKESWIRKVAHLTGIFCALNKMPGYAEQVSHLMIAASAKMNLA